MRPKSDESGWGGDEPADVNRFAQGGACAFVHRGDPSGGRGGRHRRARRETASMMASAISGSGSTRSAASASIAARGMP
jgi:hypothetical protein